MFSPRSVRNTIKIRKPILKPIHSNSDPICLQAYGQNSVPHRSPKLVPISPSQEILDLEFESSDYLDVLKSKSQDFLDDSVVISLNEALSSTNPEPTNLKTVRTQHLPTCANQTRIPLSSIVRHTLNQ